MSGIILLLPKFTIFAIVAFLLFPVSSVYGHGLGIDTIHSVDVQGKKISISVELPVSFERTLQKKKLRFTLTFPVFFDNTGKKKIKIEADEVDKKKKQIFFPRVRKKDTGSS